MSRELRIAGVCLQAQGLILVIACLALVGNFYSSFKDHNLLLVFGVFSLLFIYGLGLLKIGVGVARANIKYKKWGIAFGVLCIFTQPGGIIFGPVSLVCQYLGRHQYVAV
jgi:hypothetical protein